MRKTSIPIVVGIFNIISGIIGLLSISGLMIGIVLIINGRGILGFDIPGISPSMVPESASCILLIVAVLIAIISILSLIGGIYALQRKLWGLALAGSIAAIFIFFLLGVPAVILIAISKSEFA